ncbi:MAG: hypothetical protein ACK5FX_11720, partial [Flavobacteriia bacterium]
GGYYTYEFENGVNLSLKNLENKIKEGDAELAKKNFDRAIEIYTVDCMNNFPGSIPQNVRVQKSIQNANSQKALYELKLEQQRIAEEKRREKQLEAAIVSQEKERKKQLEKFNNSLQLTTIDYVVKRLKSPSSANVIKYNNPDQTKELLNKSGNYLPNCDNVCATMLTVDAQNGFGAFIRSTYVLFFKDNSPCFLTDVKEIDAARQSQNTYGAMNAMLETILNINECGCN